MMSKISVALALSGVLTGSNHQTISVPVDFDGRSDLLRALLSVPVPRIAFVPDDDGPGRTDGYDPAGRDGRDPGDADVGKVT